MVRRLGVFRWMTMLASRLAKSPGEIWFSLWALGFESSFTTAVILESVALVSRSGVSRARSHGRARTGLYLLGNLLGIPGEIAFALSLVRRMRELALWIPALIRCNFSRPLAGGEPGVNF